MKQDLICGYCYVIAFLCAGFLFGFPETLAGLLILLVIWVFFQAAPENES